MRWIEAAFPSRSGEIDELCMKLEELGAPGMVIEDEADFHRFLQENRQYWDYVDEALEESYRGVSRVKVYVSDDDEGKTLLAALTEGTGTEPVCRTVNDEDWENNWKQYYKPIEVGEKLLIIPMWEPIPQDIPRKVLRLDPGLTFGTGSHATTKMCLRFLEQYAAPQKFVLDIGCGSGILGIGAMVLGCGYVAGCDVDPKSPDVAAHNAALNGINPMTFRIMAGDVLKDEKLRGTLGSGYDIVLANIVADVVIPLAPYARRFMARGGVFICSGIIEGRQDEVEAALLKGGYTVLGHQEEDGWHAYAAMYK